MRLGIESVDRLLEGNERVEFYGDWDVVLYLAHRAVAASAPVNVVVVQDFGLFDPFLVKRLQRVLGNSGEVYVRRAFKAEDVKATIESFEGDVIVIDPYHHRKNYTEITSALRRAVWAFTREVKGLPQGGAFNHHSMHVIVKVSRGKWGYRFRFVKHPLLSDVEIPLSVKEIANGGIQERGLLAFI